MAELTEDQIKIVDLEKKVATLTTEKQAALDQIKILTTAKESAEKNLEQATKVVADLKTQLAEKKAGVIELPTVQVGKDTYELVGGAFTWAGKEVTHEVLLEDAKLAAELVKEKVTNLRKIEKK
ncbi:hypothetical protein [Spirosoma panaciterrae]|uniref:hypothetical protein n=1 Tax=Spirosoma panaciterrae TaxID=496058 RepID=UPI00035C832B|nr:hypothetical protein [Spirosoma panaciterrae]